MSVTCLAAAYCARLDFSAKSFGALLALSTEGSIYSCFAFFFGSGASVLSFLNLLSKTEGGTSKTFSSFFLINFALNLS